MSDNLRKIVIVGATSAIAEHCARLWVKNEAVDLTLVGRDAERTGRVADDLHVRSPRSQIRVRSTDFLEPTAITRLATEIVTEGPVDIILIAHGSLPDQQTCQQDLNACRETLAVNGISPVLFAEAFAGHMQKAGLGTMALIGSVAGDRGRRSNYVYGSAKGMVERYAQGLQHRLATSGAKVVLIKPGPTDTPMTAHLKQQGNRLASPEEVARLICKGIASGKPVVYAPARWALIMMIIRHLPRAIFNKLEI